MSASSPTLPSMSSTDEETQSPRVTQAIWRKPKDIFATPDNDDFHGHYHYEKLNPEKREIRLLQVAVDDLSCTLLPRVSLDAAEDTYVTVSYYAGKPVNTRNILVNGLDFTIFANLRHALECVQQTWKTTEGSPSCRIWVDQICINQYDLDEKSWQVRLMRDIYSKARRTLICLSTHESLALHSSRMPDACNVRPFDLLREQGVAQLSTARDRVMPRRDGDWQPLPSGPSFSRDLRLLLSSYWFVRHAPWWSRVWIRQEFIRSKGYTLMFGGDHIEDHIYEPRRVTIDKYIRTIQMYSARECLTHGYWAIQQEKPRSPNPCFACGVEEQKMQKGWEHETPSNDGHLVNESRYFVESRHAWSTSEGTSHTNSGAHFRELLNDVDLRGDCSDERDKIYGLLGLSRVDYGITPDYGSTNSYFEVKMSLFKAMVLQERRVRFLGAARIDSLTSVLSNDSRPTLHENRPTWYPDNWHWDRRTQRDDSYDSLVCYDTQERQPQLLTFEGAGACEVLVTQGRRVDVCKLDRLEQSVSAKWHGKMTETEMRLQIHVPELTLYNDSLWLIPSCLQLCVLRTYDDGFIQVGIAWPDDPAEDRCEWSDPYYDRWRLPEDQVEAALETIRLY